MFETKPELAELQRLLDASFERAGHLTSGFDAGNRLSARQLAGFQGLRLVAIATVNSKGEPRAAPRAAAFLHGRFYLAANTDSRMVGRLSKNPAMGITYFENHLLIMAHGTGFPSLKGTPGFDSIRPEWVKAFQGGDDSTDDVDIFIRVDATHLTAFAKGAENYPAAWREVHH